MGTDIDVSSRTGPRTIVLINSLHTARTGLELLLASEPDLAVVASVDRAEAAFQALPAIDDVSIILVDLTAADEGLRSLQAVRERLPQIALVATGRDADPQLISRALFFGADGFVHAGIEPARFLDAIHRALDGETVLEGLPLDAVGAVAEAIRQQQRGAALLTPREREVLAAAVDGLTARQIATRLGVRERTVTTHLGRIYAKLKANGRADAIAAGKNMALVAMGTAAEVRREATSRSDR